MMNIIWSAGQKIELNDIIKAEGCYIYDSKGNKYLDFESGIWCTSLGHSHLKVVNVIKKQVENIIHTGFCYSNDIIEKAAENFLNAANFHNGSCAFLCSGSEAVEFSIRIFKNITNKQYIMSMSDSYSGAYGAVAEKRSDQWIFFDWLECELEKCNFECNKCKKFNNIPFEKIGAFLFEPGSSSGLVRFPPKMLIEKIYKKVKENQGYILINEVTTGIGRTGKWFGFKHYNIKPDIISVGKGIGSGYPVSICAVNEEISKMIQKNEIRYSQSHQNDPLGAAVVNEVINIINEENLIKNSEKMGNYFIEKLIEIEKKFDVIKEIRGRGLMIVVEFKDDCVSTVYKKLLENYIIISRRANTNCLRIDPPLIVSKNEIDYFLNKLTEIIIELR